MSRDVRRARRRQPARGEAGDREARRDGAGRPRSARARQRSAQRRVRDRARPGADRRAARRSRRDGAGAARHGRPGRGDARERLPRRPAAAEGPDSADPLPPQHVRRRHARAGLRLGRHHDQARARQLARLDQPRLPRRRAERAQRVRAGQGRRAARALRVQPERAAVEAAHLAVAVGRRHRRVRHEDDRRGAAVRLLRRFDPQAERRAQRHRAARAHADASRRCCAPSCSATTRRPTTSASATSTWPSAATARRGPRTCLRASNAGAIGKTLYNELRAAVAGRRARVHADQHGAGGAGAERVRRRRRAARRLARLERSCRSPTTSTSPTGRHAIRTGLQLDAGRYRTDELRNTTGTFTFASLDAYAAGAADDLHAERRRSDGRRSRRRSSASTCRTTSARART